MAAAAWVVGCASGGSGAGRGGLFEREPDSSDHTVGPAQDHADRRQRRRDSLASANRDPRHDTTASDVRHLDQARKALGYDQINYSAARTA